MNEVRARIEVIYTDRGGVQGGLPDLRKARGERKGHSRERQRGEKTSLEKKASIRLNTL